MTVEVVTLGECLISLIATQPGPLAEAGLFERHVAGAEANVAVGLARLGHSVAYIGRVGGDGLGTAIVRGLRGEGVDVSHLEVDADATTGLMLRERRVLGAAEVVYARANSAGSRITPEDVRRAAADGAFATGRWLHLTGITPALSATAAAAVTLALDLASDAKMTVSFDVNLRRRLWSDDEAAPVLRPLAERANIVLGAADELAVLTGTPGPRPGSPGQGRPRPWSLDGRREARRRRSAGPPARGRPDLESGSGHPVCRGPGRCRRRLLRRVHRGASRGRGHRRRRFGTRTRVGRPPSPRSATWPVCRPTSSSRGCSRTAVRTRSADRADRGGGARVRRRRSAQRLSRSVPAPRRSGGARRTTRDLPGRQLAGAPGEGRAAGDGSAARSLGPPRRRGLVRGRRPVVHVRRDVPRADGPHRRGATVRGGGPQHPHGQPAPDAGLVLPAGGCATEDPDRRAALPLRPARARRATSRGAGWTRRQIWWSSGRGRARTRSASRTSRPRSPSTARAWRSSCSTGSTSRPARPSRSGD